MLNITFRGAPFLFIGCDLDHSGAITTPEAFKAGEASFGHYYPTDGGVVKRYGVTIGTREELAVVGPAPRIAMDPIEVLLAMANMLGGDPAWDFPKGTK